MIPLFNLQSHCSTGAVQLLGEGVPLGVSLTLVVFHTTYSPSPSSASGTASPSPRLSAAPACVILCDVLLAV
jgi:hypothetical protein